MPLTDSQISNRMTFGAYLRAALENAKDAKDEQLAREIQKLLDFVLPR